MFNYKLLKVIKNGLFNFSFISFLCILFLKVINPEDVYGVSIIEKKRVYEENFLTKVLSTETLDEDEANFKFDMISSIEDFINLPEGGTPWKVFADTGMDEYYFEDKDGFEWTGVRPNFTEQIRMLDNKEILVQGYMFPLDQNEKQSTFLLIPFPVHCPYYPHASSNLIIEVHAKKPIIYSYDPINIKGKLELVPKDDLYNIFFRITNAKLESN